MRSEVAAVVLFSESNQPIIVLLHAFQVVSNAYNSLFNVIACLNVAVLILEFC